MTRPRDVVTGSGSAQDASEASQDRTPNPPLPMQGRSHGRNAVGWCACGPSPSFALPSPVSFPPGKISKALELNPERVVGGHGCSRSWLVAGTRERLSHSACPGPPYPGPSSRSWIGTSDSGLVRRSGSGRRTHMARGSTRRPRGSQPDPEARPGAGVRGADCGASGVRPPSPRCPPRREPFRCGYQRCGSRGCCIVSPPLLDIVMLCHA